MDMTLRFSGDVRSVNAEPHREHCNVAATMVAGGNAKVNPLASWCEEQRGKFVDGKLDQGTIDKLNSLGFDFFGGSSTESQPVSPNDNS